MRPKFGSLERLAKLINLQARSTKKNKTQITNQKLKKGHYD